MKWLTLSLFFLTVSAGTAGAQLPSPSTRALGVGDNYTALARGFSAAAWNPALLGVSGNPGVSFALLPARAIAGLDPVTLADLKDFEGKFVPANVREQWLTQIESEGSEDGTAGGDATLLAAQFGPVALQIASSFRTVGDLSPGAAELLLFGNAGRTGQPRDFNLSGSSIHAHAFSTVGLSFGLPIRNTPASRAAIGITAKYTMGHFFATGEDDGSTITDEPNVNLRFPLVATSTDDFNANGGNGLGLDIGLAMEKNRITIGLAVKNVVNTFKWDADKLRFRQGIASFDESARTSNFDEQSFSSAPANLRQLAEDATFKPTLAAGVAFQASPKFTVSSDVRARLGDTTLEVDPKLHLGAGAEFRVLPLLPLRAGVAIVTGGFQFGGGVGVELGPLNLAASVARRKSDLGSDTITMITLLSTTGR